MGQEDEEKQLLELYKRNPKFAKKKIIAEELLKIANDRYLSTLSNIGFELIYITDEDNDNIRFRLRYSPPTIKETYTAKLDDIISDEDVKNTLFNDDDILPRVVAFYGLPCSDSLFKTFNNWIVMNIIKMFRLSEIQHIKILEEGY